MLESRSGSAAQCKEISRRIVAACILLAFAATPGAAGQQNPAPEQSTTTLRVSTEVVNVLAIVKDKHGKLIPGLTKNDFSLEEDGKPQDIRYFSRETDTPLTMGILIDTSGSEERMLPLEQEQADAFINQVLRPKDLAFVLHFDLYVELLQDFTSDRARLVRAIDSTRINAGGGGALPGTFPGVSVGGTHLYDAVYLAAHDMLRNEIGRKVIIVLTDGEDQGSKETLDAALESAQKSDVIIYSIATIDRSFYRGVGMGFGGEGVLEKLSNQTGGRMIRASRQKDLAEAFQEIAEELRTQYLLGYTPTNAARDGSFRRIRVQVRDNHYKVQARRGYYAPSN